MECRCDCEWSQKLPTMKDRKASAANSVDLVESSQSLWVIDRSWKLTVHLWGGWLGKRGSKADFQQIALSTHSTFSHELDLPRLIAASSSSNSPIADASPTDPRAKLSL